MFWIWLVTGVVIYIVYLVSRFNEYLTDRSTEDFGMWALHKLDYILGVVLGPASFVLLLILVALALGRTVTNKN